MQRRIHHFYQVEIPSLHLNLALTSFCTISNSYFYFNLVPQYCSEKYIKYTQTHMIWNAGFEIPALLTNENHFFPSSSL